MSDQKKSRYSSAQKKSYKKYTSEKVDSILLRVPKGNKSIIKDHAESHGESLNAFLNRAIDETIERDNADH